MSHSINDDLLDEAEFYRDYFSGTIMEKLISHDIEINDLEQLQVHLREARQTAYQKEYQPNV